ncbi:flagellar M-ring protein FliF C-terminal domain-containing protein [Kaarinaea lacus]
MSEQLRKSTVDDKRSHSALAGSKAVLIVVMLGGLLILGLVMLVWFALYDYTELSTGLGVKDATLVTTELQNNNISYHYEPSTGTVLVRPEQLNRAQKLLIEKGLFQDHSFSAQQKYADLRQEQSQTTGGQGSPHQVLEVELAKSIASIDYVQSARVHLAFDNAVGGPSHAASASVVVRLYPGRRLTEVQISSISHLVAASAANLSIESITIIDQAGQLLKSAGATKPASMTSAQFSYLRRLEQAYIDRIEDVLTPVLGRNSLRAQVVADVDFKSFNPDTADNPRSIDNVLENASVRRLTVTLIVDSKLINDENGEPVSRVARSAEEIQRITDLVKHAIGFDSQRGDTVTVVNEPSNVFSNRHTPVTVSVWKVLSQRNSLWYLVFGFIALIIVGFIMQAMRVGLKARRTLSMSSAAALPPDVYMAKEGESRQHGTENPPRDDSAPSVTLEQHLSNARQLVRNDPRIVAQIIRAWVKESD